MFCIDFKNPDNKQYLMPGFDKGNISKTIIEYYEKNGTFPSTDYVFKNTSLLKTYALKEVNLHNVKSTTHDISLPKIRSEISKANNRNFKNGINRVYSFTFKYVGESSLIKWELIQKVNKLNIEEKQKRAKSQIYTNNKVSEIQRNTERLYEENNDLKIINPDPINDPVNDPVSKKNVQLSLNDMFEDLLNKGEIQKKCNL